MESPNKCEFADKQVKGLIPSRALRRNLDFGKVEIASLSRIDIVSKSGLKPQSPVPTMNVADTRRRVASRFSAQASVLNPYSVYTQSYTK